jgi:hypothetical protein
MGYIDHAAFARLARALASSSYGEYLLRVMEEESQ